MSTMKRSKSLSDLQHEQMERMSSESGGSAAGGAPHLSTMRRARSHENIDAMERDDSEPPAAGARNMLSEKELRDHFNMPLNEVAKKFGMCTTALKKLCRKYGVMQWPHRKLRSLEKKIASLRAEQRYTSDGGTHHNIDDEIRKLEQQREMLLNGDGQLHEYDWGGIGEDGEYEMGGDGDDPHNDSFKSMSRSNSRNSLSGRSPAPSGTGRGGGGARGGGQASADALHEHITVLEGENVSLRALTRSLMNERHQLLSSLDNTAGHVAHLRRMCSSLQSRLLAAGVKPEGPAMGTLDPEAGCEQHAEAHHRVQQQRPHSQANQPFHEQARQPMRQHERSQQQQHAQGRSLVKLEDPQDGQDQFQQQQQRRQQHHPSQQQRHPPHQHSQPASIGSQGPGSYGGGFRGGNMSFDHSPASAFGQAQSSPGFGGMPSFGVGVPSPMIRSSDSQHGGQRSQRSSSSPFDRPVPPHLQHKAQASTEERDLDENALAWMAPDFDLDELL